MTIDEAIARYKNNAEHERTLGSLQGCLEFRQLADLNHTSERTVRNKMDKLSRNIIEHAKRLKPKALSYKGLLTDKQFYEIERECDIDFFKLVSQDVKYTIRYRGELKDGKKE